MTEHITIPVKVVKGVKWGDLNALSITHEVCGEVVKLKDDKFPMSGGHRVRLYHFKKNVHWRVANGLEVDITEVKPSEPPPKQAAKRRRQ